MTQDNDSADQERDQALRARRRRSRAALIALALLFFGPLAASWLYHLGGGDWHPPPKSSGVLVDDPLDLGEVPLRILAGGDGSATLSGRWTLLYPGPAHCDAPCSRLLYELRQVHLALGGDADRLRRVYLVDSGAPTGIGHAGRSDLIIAASPQARAAVERLSRDLRQPAPSFYLLDPAGRTVTAYSADFEQRGLLEDIERLLEFSSL